MKFIHLSDLHLGKRVNEFSMIEDQKYILSEILNIIDSKKPDCVIIAGDIYDKPVPSAEAVSLFDDFLCKLSERLLKVFVISGNHDSAERIAFGSRLMDKSGIYMSPVYDGNVAPIKLTDSFGVINVFILPFLKPANVRNFFDEEISTYTDALRAAINQMNVNTSERNILVTHQFVTGASRSDSEEISVGGSDNVDASVFDDFDYVALGHIHRPQNVGRETLRYCGTPLKYSFSEAKHDKSVTVLDILEKGNINIETVPLIPLRDLREIKGSYMLVTSKNFYEGTNQNDYIHVTLTDEEDIPEAIGKLRVIYPNIMKLDYDNKRTRTNTKLEAIENIQKKSELELFMQFYEKQNNQPMNDEQLNFVQTLIEELKEVE